MTLYDDLRFMYEGGLIDWDLAGTLMFERLIPVHRSYEEWERLSDMNVGFHKKKPVATLTDEDREFLKELKIKA
jgi:hypothetical protein